MAARYSARSFTGTLRKSCALNPHITIPCIRLLQEGKTAAGKSQNHFVVLCGTLSPSLALSNLPDGDSAYQTANALVYQHQHGVERPKQEGRKNAREEQCPVTIEPDP